MRTTYVLTVVLGLALLAGCGDQANPDAATTTPSNVPPAAPASETSGPPVLDQYAGKSYLLVAAPATGDATYKKYRGNLAKIERLALSEIGLDAIIEVVGGKTGKVLNGPALDAESIELLKTRHKLDPATTTVTIISNKGEELVRQTGDVDIETMLMSF